MKPALSVIFFTVASGAGLGLLIWLAAAVVVSAPIDARNFGFAMVTSAILVTAGLLSSTLHLANPKHAWQSFRRFGSSWLSREAVLAVLLFPAGLWFATQGSRGGWQATAAAVVIILLAIAVLLSTAMIYACLRTVPHWNNWQTRNGMPWYGLMTGGLLMLAIMPLQIAERPLRLVVIALLLGGLAIKYSYFVSYRKMGESAPSANEALKLGLEPGSGKINARVRLLDVGHAHGTFLTREFGYEVSRSRVLGLRLFALGAGFLLPVVVLLWWRSYVWLVVASSIAGLLVERWLFFAEARHVVRRYHGMSMV
jgi:DMSO reductase anchor subunit